MKKPFLIVTSLFILGTTQAQTVLTFGPKVGVNLSTLTGKSDFTDKKLLTGFNTGLVLNISINEIFSVQPELFFSQQGYKISATILDAPATITQTLNYINLPVLAKASFGERNIKGYVNLGPYLGYMVGGHETIDIEGNKESERTNFDKRTELNRLDFGIAAGVGALYRTGHGDVILDVRYNVGLTPVSDDVVLEAGRDTNSVLGISVGYLFPIGTR